MRAFEVEEVNPFAGKLALLIGENELQKHLIGGAGRCFGHANAMPIMIHQRACSLGIPLSTIGFSNDIIGAGIAHRVDIANGLIGFVGPVILAEERSAGAIHHKGIDERGTTDIRSHVV